MKIQYQVGVPYKPTDTIRVAGVILQKHLELGAESPLAGLKLETARPVIEECVKIEARLQELNAELGLLESRREALYGSVKDVVQCSRSILLGTYRKDPHKLTHFGFQVAQGGFKRVRRSDKTETGAVESTDTAATATPASATVAVIATAPAPARS